MPIGAQLIIWGNDLPKNYEQIFSFCRDKGYDFLEAPKIIMEIPPNHVRDACVKAGVPMFAIHVGYPDISQSTSLEKVLRYAADAGVRVLISSGLAHGDNPPSESAKTLNDVGQKAKDQGIQFYHHTHWWEFNCHEAGPKPIVYLLDKTDPEKVKFNLDICWAYSGGQDPIQAIALLGSRCDYFHIKDGVLTNNPQKVRWKTLGNGQVPIKECLWKLDSRLDQYRLIIEQDEPIGSPEEDMAANISYVRKTFHFFQNSL